LIDSDIDWPIGKIKTKWGTFYHIKIELIVLVACNSKVIILMISLLGVLRLIKVGKILFKDVFADKTDEGAVPVLKVSIIQQAQLKYPPFSPSQNH